MRCYSREDEERIHAVGLVRKWTRSRLIDAAQAEQLETELKVELRRTNHFLRATLAFFTAIVVAASVVFVISLLGLRDEVAIAAVAAITAPVCAGLAEHLIARFRLYRFGVEESLANAAVVLVCFGAAILTSGRNSDISVAVIGAAGGVGLYVRYGYLYAALASIVCIAAIPFQLNVTLEVQHTLAAAGMMLVLVAIRPKRAEHRDDYLGADYRWLHAVAFAGVYLALNLQIPWSWYGTKGVFYWTTYFVSWLLPPIGLTIALRDKDRQWLDVGIALSLVTLMTNKSYLGWPRQTWDPILLGIVLIAVATAVRRWLASGPGGERHGFTPERLLEQDRARLSLAGTGSVVLGPRGGSSAAEPTESPFRGGRSGGGGASGSF